MYWFCFGSTLAFLTFLKRQDILCRIHQQSTVFTSRDSMRYILLMSRQPMIYPTLMFTHTEMITFNVLSLSIKEGDGWRGQCREKLRSDHQEPNGLGPEHKLDWCSLNTNVYMSLVAVCMFECLFFKRSDNMSSQIYQMKIRSYCSVMRPTHQTFPLMSLCKLVGCQHMYVSLI